MTPPLPNFWELNKISETNGISKFALIIIVILIILAIGYIISKIKKGVAKRK